MVQALDCVAGSSTESNTIHEKFPPAAPCCVRCSGQAMHAATFPLQSDMVMDASCLGTDAFWAWLHESDSDTPMPTSPPFHPADTVTASAGIPPVVTGGGSTQAPPRPMPAVTDAVTPGGLHVMGHAGTADAPLRVPAASSLAVPAAFAMVPCTMPAMMPAMVAGVAPGGVPHAGMGAAPFQAPAPGSYFLPWGQQFPAPPVVLGSATSAAAAAVAAWYVPRSLLPRNQGAVETAVALRRDKWSRVKERRAASERCTIVRYEKRKRSAQMRPRVQGRFVRKRPSATDGCGSST